MLKPEFQQFKGFFFDLDGVIWEGSSLLPGAKKLLDILLDSKKQIGFISNNSTLTIEDYLKKFDRLNLTVKKKQVITSTQATIHYLNYLKPKLDSIFVIGEKALKESLINDGYSVNEGFSNPDLIDAVVVGMDRNFSYRKIEFALRAISAGARFIGTNSDPLFLTPQGISPGAGSMISALVGALNKTPEKICGKPDSQMANILLTRLDLKASQCVMIGDRISTDLKMAINAKITPVLVKTGFGEQEIEKYPNFLIYKTISNLEDMFFE